MRLRGFPGLETRRHGAAGRVVRGSLLWAAVHSLLASRQVKDLVSRVAGPRYRRGLYRALYNAQSTATLIWAVRWFLRLPDRELYRVSPPYSWLFRAGQAGSLAVLLSGVGVIGVLDFAGITSLWDLLRGRDPRPEPEAQGPPVDADGEIVKAGAFRFTRHPGNLGAVGVFALFPRMTVNRAVVLALAVLYAVAGSLHEERRLRASYGAAYERYRRLVPFFVPRLRGR